MSVFSNFIDIWNLHRSFFTILTGLLEPSLSSPDSQPPPLSPVLLSHFPYLSLYTPFITSFPTVLTSLSVLSKSNPAFADFVKRKEADPRCGKLKLRDWLLTIVQRCPRYLLLLKDLIDATDPESPERDSLVAAHVMLAKSELLSLRHCTHILITLGSYRLSEHLTADALADVDAACVAALNVRPTFSAHFPRSHDPKAGNAHVSRSRSWPSSQGIPSLQRLSCLAGRREQQLLSRHATPRKSEATRLQAHTQQK